MHYSVFVAILFSPLVFATEDSVPENTTLLSFLQKRAAADEALQMEENLEAVVALQKLGPDVVAYDAALDAAEEAAAALSESDEDKNEKYETKEGTTDDRTVEVVLKIGEETPKMVLTKGDKLLVRIPGNTTTGFTWSITKDCEGRELPGNVLTPEGQADTRTKPLRIGSGGDSLFSFEAKHRGSQKLCFEEKQQWEGGEKGGEAWLTVDVTSDDEVVEETETSEVDLVLGDEKQIDITQGEELVVRIPGNTTTGFTWSINEDCDPQKNVLTAKKHTYTRTTPARIGSGGLFVFTFEATRQGRQKLCFEYKRQWEGGEKGGDASLTVNVMPTTNEENA